MTMFLASHEGDTIKSIQREVIAQECQEDNNGMNGFEEMSTSEKKVLETSQRQHLLHRNVQFEAWRAHKHFVKVRT